MRVRSVQACNRCRSSFKSCRLHACVPNHAACEPFIPASARHFIISCRHGRRAAFGAHCRRVLCKCAPSLQARATVCGPVTRQKVRRQPRQTGPATCSGFWTARGLCVTPPPVRRSGTRLPVRHLFCAGDQGQCRLPSVMYAAAPQKAFAEIWRRSDVLAPDGVP